MKNKIYSTIKPGELVLVLLILLFFLVWLPSTKYFPLMHLPIKNICLLIGIGSIVVLLLYYWSSRVEIGNSYIIGPSRRGISQRIKIPFNEAEAYYYSKESFGLKFVLIKHKNSKRKIIVVSHLSPLSLTFTGTAFEDFFEDLKKLLNPKLLNDEEVIGFMKSIGY